MVNARLYSTGHKTNNKDDEYKKEHGNDGIIAEEYKAALEFLTQPLAQLLTQIKNGQELPPR